jgi:sugar transferase (PEP-CTERM system associated)
MVAMAGIEAIALGVTPYLAAYIRFGEEFDDLGGSIGTLWIQGIVFAATMMLALFAMGMYSARQRSSPEGLVLRIIGAGVFAYVALAFLYYSVPSHFLGRGILALMILVGATACATIRVIMSYVVDESIFKRRVLVYGAGKQAALITQLRRRSDQRGFVIVGFVKCADGSVDVAPEKLLQNGGSLLTLCRQLQVDEIVVAMDDRRRSFPVKDLLDCRLSDIDVIDLPSFLERETGKVRLEVMTPSWMIFGEGFSRSAPRQVTARTLDILASLVLLSLTWPIMLVTIIAIKLEDGIRAPVLYRQRRVGFEGKTFDVLKFRSMRVDAEKDGRAQWAKKGDRRVTRVGSVSRTIRIDELPQIFNVLAGDMRFVGPRPERPEFVEELSEKIPYYRERHFVKPGITGWAQLCYAYGASHQDAIEKLQYDLYYVKNHSLLFDLSILVQTVEVILWRKGAR